MPNYFRSPTASKKEIPSSPPAATPCPTRPRSKSRPTLAANPLKNQARVRTAIRKRTRSSCTVELTSGPMRGSPGSQSGELWFQRFSRPTIFLIIALALVGAYTAFTIPVSVFPDTDFPRIVIGVDNGVAPIDQMLVTVTRPIEEAVNSVQGLERVKSVTSRGTAQVDLYFDWGVNMFETLARVNAALAQAQAELPSTARVNANPLTFAAFPILGYSLTSEKVSQTRLWEIATY